MQVKTLILSTFGAVGLTTGALAGDVSWDGGASTTNWGDEDNWSNDALPTLDDRVTISGTGDPIDVNIAGAKAGVLVLSGRGLDILVDMQLEIDGTYSGGSQNSSIASGVTIDLEAADSVLKFSGTTTLEGDGKVVGFDDPARIEVTAGKTLTLASGTTIEGQMQIKGLSAIGGNGGFVNNGTVEANRAGTLLVHVDTVLQAGTGMFRVATSGATLQFDAGTARDTEAGDVFVSDGTIYFAVDCCFDDFEWDGGLIDGVDGERFWYDSYNPGSAKSNPFDGTDGNYQYVDQYPNS